MRATVIHGPRDVRFEEWPEPRIVEPTDAIIRIAAACVCGSDLWPYRGLQPLNGATPMGHEYCGFVEDVGGDVRNVKPGQFVVGSFASSDNTCAHCQHGYQSSCVHREFLSGAQAPYFRVPLADGTLVPTPERPDDSMIPALLTASDVLGTGWFAADAANVRPGATVVVVGDGAVGLLGVLSARQMGAERIIAMSRHPSRQKLAREFRGDRYRRGARRGRRGTHQGPDRRHRRGLRDSNASGHRTRCCSRLLRRGPAVRSASSACLTECPSTAPASSSRMCVFTAGLRLARYLPHLIDLVLQGAIDPGRVFDLVLPLEQVAEGYAAMDDRRAIKAMLQP